MNEEEVGTNLVGAWCPKRILVLVGMIYFDVVWYWVAIEHLGG